MKKLLTWVTLLFIIASCREIQEKDITNTTVELVSPQDQYRSVVLNQTFYWNKVDGASGYRIQIATPSFAPDSISLVLDSTTTKTQFSKSLPYGKKYQWRVMAINGGYDSKFTNPRTLHIDSSAVIAFQIVELLSPKDEYYSNKKEVEFIWNSLAQATSYFINIDSAGKSNIYGPKQFTTTSTSYTFDKEAKYTWNVVGYDGTNYSSASKRIVYVDTTAPSVNLTSPADKASVRLADSSTFSLKWTSSDSPSSFSKVKTHYVYVYTDSLKTSIYSSTYNGKVNTGFEEKFKLPSNYNVLWWAVQAVDMAGNKSKVTHRRFTISK